MDLSQYDVILLNTSGGKDSQTMIRFVHGLAVAQGVTERLVAVHADLGRVEWEGTRELAGRQAEAFGIRFEVTKRPQGDLLTHVRARGRWPSSTNRYCTSDHKRGQVGRVITYLVNECRELQPGKRVRVLNCFGFRADESPARAKRPVLDVNKRASNGKREVTDWLPIHTWTEAEVWADIKASRIEYHGAYDLGMPRLSCVFCIFAPKAALILAGQHNRALLQEYADLETEMHHTFRTDTTIADVLAAVESGEQAEGLGEAWNM